MSDYQFQQPEMIVAFSMTIFFLLGQKVGDVLYHLRILT